MEIFGFELIMFIQKITIKNFRLFPSESEFVIENINITVLENSDVEAPETLETTTVPEEEIPTDE